MDRGRQGPGARVTQLAAHSQLVEELQCVAEMLARRLTCHGPCGPVAAIERAAPFGTASPIHYTPALRGDARDGPASCLEAPVAAPATISKEPAAGHTLTDSGGGDWAKKICLTPGPSASPPPSVTVPGPRVGERSPHHLRNRDELPAIGPRCQCQPEDTVVVAAGLAVGNRGPEPIGAAAPRPDHELADPPHGVGPAVRRLEREALIVVLVSRQDHVRPGFVQRLPQRLRLRVAAVGRARAEAGVMPISERAELGVRGEVGAHPKLCTLAYWHHARFSSGTTHGSDPQTQPLWQALYEAGADVVLSGHEDNYERFALQTPDGKADPA